MRTNLNRLLYILTLLFLSSATALALPSGQQVVNGNATFSTQGNSLTITNTPNTIINWQSFSILGNEAVLFSQQSSSSSVLNRITGQNPSYILGLLQSNGRVFLINPNGIFFGQGSQVNVSGLIVSTLGISNKDFLAGNYNFTAGATSGPIQNQGNITTPSGGIVYLIGPSLENSGIITTPNGQVLLAAGHSVQLVDSSNPDIAVVVSADGDSAVNLGQIIAQSGKVGIYGGLITQSGIVSANSATVGSNGQIIFKAANNVTLDAGSVTSANGASGGQITIQSAAGNTSVSGIVSAKGSDGAGGNIEVLGNNIALTSSALLDASGKSLGGYIKVLGDMTTGTVQVAGTLNASGLNGGDSGFIETSAAHLQIDNTARITSGQWLLDPVDLTIDSGAANAIDTALNAGNVTVQTTDSLITTTTTYGGTVDRNGNGNLIVTSSINWSSNSTLTLDAYGSINLNASNLTGGNESIVNLYAPSGSISGTGIITAGTLNASAFSGINLTGYNVVPIVSLENGNSALGNIVYNSNVGTGNTLSVSGYNLSSGGAFQVSESGGNLAITGISTNNGQIVLDTFGTPGDITVAGAIYTGANGVVLASTGGSINGPGIITASSLNSEALTGISLTGMNLVPTVSLTNTGRGTISYNSNVGSGNFLSVSGSTNNYTCGDFTITENTGGITVNTNNITTNNSFVTLSAANDINVIGNITDGAGSPSLVTLASTAGNVNGSGIITAGSLTSSALTSISLSNIEAPDL